MLFILTLKAVWMCVHGLWTTAILDILWLQSVCELLNYVNMNYLVSSISILNVILLVLKCEICFLNVCKLCCLYIVRKLGIQECIRNGFWD